MVPFSESMGEHEIVERLTIKKVVATQGEADREVLRLNELEAQGNREPGRFYFVQYTRLFVGPAYLAATLPE
jgi:hypothetical protein